MLLPDEEKFSRRERGTVGRRICESPGQRAKHSRNLPDLRPNAGRALLSLRVCRNSERRLFPAPDHLDGSASRGYAGAQRHLPDAQLSFGSESISTNRFGSPLVVGRCETAIFRGVSNSDTRVALHDAVGPSTASSNRVNAAGTKKANTPPAAQHSPQPHHPCFTPSKISNSSPSRLHRQTVRPTNS